MKVEFWCDTKNQIVDIPDKDKDKIDQYFDDWMAEIDSGWIIIEDAE